jgi:beta-hydroxyacyl-ACP dehydratase FabZ
MAFEKGFYDINAIMRILPHRYPFLLVDRIIELTEGKNPPSRLGRKAVGIKNVSFNEPFFTGHFPHRPIMPGVLLVETIAQVGALACFRQADPQMDFFIANIKDAKFRKLVEPGDTLVVTTEVMKDRGSMLIVKGFIEVDGKLAAEAEILASVTVKASK